VATLTRHLLEKEPISKLCDEAGLKPTVFYRWQKEFFENGAAAFEQKRPTNHSADHERIAYLQKKIQKPALHIPQCLLGRQHDEDGKSGWHCHFVLWNHHAISDLAPESNSPLLPMFST
jgi:hypothetical protein